jgi:antitoxin HigA-1
MATRKSSPIHPGEILAHEFLAPLGVTQYRLAQDISVPPRRINEIVHGKRAISADTALRLARYFGTSERFWLNLQTRFELEIQRDRLGDSLIKEVRTLYPRPNATAKHVAESVAKRSRR